MSAEVALRAPSRRIVSGIGRVFVGGGRPSGSLAPYLFGVQLSYPFKSLQVFSSKVQLSL